MMNLRESTFCRALFVALALLFVLGSGIPESSFARIWMQNEHEGDPVDGYDSGAGGGGSSDSVGGGGVVFSGNEALFPSTEAIYFGSLRFVFSGQGGHHFILNPVFKDGIVIWTVVIESIPGGRK